MRTSAMAVRSATGMRSTASTRHTSRERESVLNSNGMPPMTKSVSMSVLNKATSKVVGYDSNFA